MNWIKENKFLFGLLVVVMLGVIGGGVMLYFAYSHYDEVSQNFDKEAREYNRLRTLKPYPDQKNLAEMNNQKDAYAASIASLRDTLAGLVIKPEPIKTQEFQDRLNKAVAAVRTRAAKSSPPVKLSDKEKPEKFYLGFDHYQNELPRDDVAAAALNRELKAIEMIVETLIDAKIDTLTTFRRADLPEEKGSAPAPQQQANKNKPNTIGAQQPLVVKRTLDLAFVADQNSFRSVLNKLTSSKKQFFITRLVQIRNTAEKAPVRAPAAADAPAPAAPAPDAAAPAAPAAPDAPATPAPALVPAPEAPAASASKYIVGEEKVSVTMKLEIVDFPVKPTK
jgi:hypothetical protein